MGERRGTTAKFLFRNLPNEHVPDDGDAGTGEPVVNVDVGDDASPRDPDTPACTSPHDESTQSRLEKGESVYYSKNGVQFRCTVASVHLEDGVPYYTVTKPDGGERGTTGKFLFRNLPNDVPDDGDAGTGEPGVNVDVGDDACAEGDNDHTIGGSTFTASVEIMVDVPKTPLAPPTKKCINVAKHNSIHMLKTRLHELSGIDPADQVLSHGGRILEDSFTVGHYNLKDDDMVMLLLRLRGGNDETTPKKKPAKMGRPRVVTGRSPPGETAREKIKSKTTREKS